MIPGRFLRINQLIQIKVSSGEYSETYNSRIEDIRDDALIVAMPLFNRRLVPLRPGSLVQVSVAARDAVYSFDAQVVSRTLKPVPLVELRVSSAAERSQRREHVRVPAKLPVYYRNLSDPMAHKKLMDPAETVDISGGGLLAVFSASSRTPIPGDDSDLELELYLPGRDLPVRLGGRAIRVWKEGDTEFGSLYKMAISFTRVEERDYEDIIRYIVERQRELRLKGVL
ncbi:MAG: flagellar brake protein [Firmicutes bacterium]|nr:flagellar brake protein [Bacillota bacterium]